MNFTLYDQTVPVFVHMLNNLSAILKKGEQYAESKKFPSANLLNSRLAPDMLTLTNQVQIACDTAKFAIARTAGVEAPKFDDKETSFAELQERIAATLHFIQGVPRVAIEAGSNRIAEWKSRGKTLTKPVPEYLSLWAFPNFYFHVSTAYALLRHNGVEIGKADYHGKIVE